MKSHVKTRTKEINVAAEEYIFQQNYGNLLEGQVILRTQPKQCVNGIFEEQDVSLSDIDLSDEED